jgi:hypothetical protein
MSNGNGGWKERNAHQVCRIERDMYRNKYFKLLEHAEELKKVCEAYMDDLKVSADNLYEKDPEQAMLMRMTILNIDFLLNPEEDDTETLQ